MSFKNLLLFLSVYMHQQLSEIFPLQLLEIQVQDDLLCQDDASWPVSCMLSEFLYDQMWVEHLKLNNNGQLKHILADQTISFLKNKMLKLNPYLFHVSLEIFQSI